MERVTSKTKNIQASEQVDKTTRCVLRFDLLPGYPLSLSTVPLSCATP